MTPVEISLGFSPCPNDTFIFYALAHGKAGSPGLKFRPRIEDVEALNGLAMEGALDVTKASFHAYGHLRDKYVCLGAGAALGRGCGPLLVSRNISDPRELKGKKVAIPGGYTTAALLLKLYDPGLCTDFVPMLFSDVMKAVRGGEAEAGLVIHEGRFTYESFGLNLVIDLGTWWEGETGLPLPLGGIIARRSLGKPLLLKIEQSIRQSVTYSIQHPAGPVRFIKEHAQELDETVIESHICLYVNEDTLEVSREGREALAVLFRRAEDAGVLPASGGGKSLFLE